ncbi:hypothetical protein EMGR_003930 [Emarellia grisea]|nr:hypothetical protein KXW62_005942 [Aspergillus fumigatus]
MVLSSELSPANLSGTEIELGVRVTSRRRENRSPTPFGFKAARNDPRRTPTPEYYIRRTNRRSVAGTSGDSSEDLSLASDWSGASEDDIFAGFEDLGQLDGRIIEQEPTEQKTTDTKAIALLVLVGEQCRPELARLG